jgi:hypothetical protein
MTTFIQALNFITTKALISNLQPSAERAERGQIFCSVTDSLSRRCKAAIFLAFSRCVVVEKTFLAPLASDSSGPFKFVFFGYALVSSLRLLIRY